MERQRSLGIDHRGDVVERAVRGVPGGRAGDIRAGAGDEGAGGGEGGVGAGDGDGGGGGGEWVVRRGMRGGEEREEGSGRMGWRRG